MRQKNLYVLSFLFVFLGISLFACGKAKISTSTPTSTSAPAPAPVVNLPIPTHMTVVPPTPFYVFTPTPTPAPVGTSSETALFFLWDDSQSILDAEYCGGTNLNYRVELPRFFVKLMSEPETRGVQIGLGSMMDGFVLVRELQAPNSLKNLPWAQYENKPLEQLSSDTSYEESLSEVGGLLKEGSADRRVLVVLTDGFISSKTDAIEKEIENLVTRDIQVYVMLLCPNELKEKENDDFEFWTRTIATKEGVTVEQSGSPNRWAEVLIDALHSYLPKEGLWVSNDLPPLTDYLDGDATAIDERWFPFGKTGGEIKLTIDDRAYTLPPNQNIPLQLKPGCGPFSLSASVQGNTSGFLIIKPDLPELKMDLPDAVIEDNNDIKFKVNIRATNISYSQLTDRLACYTLDATLEPDSASRRPQLEIIQPPQIRNDGNGSYLQATGRVSNLSYEGPGKIGIRVGLATGGDQRTSDSFVIPVRFRTIMATRTPEGKKVVTSGDARFNVWKYSFGVHYDLGSDVIVEMETNLSPKGLSDGTKGLSTDVPRKSGDNKYCPEPKNDNHRVRLSIGGGNLVANDFAGYVRSNYNPRTLEAQFDIYAYQFLSDVCGYRTYYFSWPDNPEYGIVGSRFKCELQDDHFVCEEMTHE